MVISVDDDGADFESIQAAVNAASVGDTIQVYPGTYNENIDVNKQLTIISTNGAEVTHVIAASAENHVFNVTADGVMIDGFNVSGFTEYSKAGIYLDSSNSTLTNINAVNNTWGIYLNSCRNNTLTNNNVANNSYDGIIPYYSSNITLTNNMAANNKFGIRLYYSINNTLVNNTATNNSHRGILLVDSSDNTLVNNTASNNDYGIYLSSSSDNILVNNRAVDNSEDGIYLFYTSNNNMLKGNIASNNANSGIWMYCSFYNKVVGNSVSNNNECGIYLYSCLDNLIYNNFFNNTVNKKFNEALYPTSNIWNINKTAGTNIAGGPYLGGNYWARPDGWGFSQRYEDIDGDGICNAIYDLSYTLGSNNKDYLPLASWSTGNLIYPVASFTTDIVEGTVPLTVQFIDTSTNTTSWSWDFGDGCTSTEQNPVYTYSSAGSYYVTLTAANDDGSDTAITAITVYPRTYYTGDRIWDENAGQSTTYCWDAKSFSGFIYDLDSGLSSESMIIHNIDRSLGDGDIVYQTRPMNTDFGHSGWGSYQMVPFMTERYFEGYTSNTDIDGVEEVSMLSYGQLSKILVDDDEKKSVNVSSSLELEENYSLNIVEIDTNGGSVYVTLSKDNINLDSSVVCNGDDYVYNLGLGNFVDITTIAVHFNETFTDNGINGVIIDGIFQISDSFLELDAGDTYGYMEITSRSSDLVEMENDCDILLSKGRTVNLMDNINLVVADNDDLRFAPSFNISENKTYELRGTVSEDDTLLTWTPLNFEGFYYDIDEGIQTEILELKSISGRTIDDGDLVYTSIPVPVEFEHSDWGEFQVIGFMAEKYFAGYTDDTNIDGLDDVNLLSQGNLSKLLINDDDSFLIYSDSSLIFEEDYVFGITDINTSANEILLTLTKDGQEIDSNTVSSSSDYIYSQDIGNNTNVTLIAVHFKDIIVAGGRNGVFIEGLFQISDQFITFTDGDGFEKMEIISYNKDSIVMKNEDSISLSKGAIINITDNIKFRVADCSTLRYYPFVIEGTSSVDTEVTIPEEDDESDTESPTTTSSSSGGGGGGTTGEKYENILVKEVQSIFVNSGSHINYEFKENGNAISSIEFDSLKNSGKIQATIEVLKDRSSFADTYAPGKVYQQMNIWVGKSGFVTPDNIENLLITFKVERSWLEENNIEITTMSLYRYADNTWNTLPTSVIEEDDEFVYFESETIGFSPFAISSGTEVIEVVEEESLRFFDDTIEEETTNIEKTESTNSSTGLLAVLGGISVLLIGAYVFCNKRS